MWSEIAPDLYLWSDCCNVYAIRRGEEALLVDAGTGLAADGLAAIGVRRVTHVLHTHHHRDQCQGSPALHARGAALWAPEYEAELLGDPEGMWQGRPLLNSYSGRSDRFSPLEGLPLAGVLRDYAEWVWRDVRLRVLPTPGHTMGSSTLIWDAPFGQRLAFTGDLLYAPGKVWSLGTLQYDYNGCDGALLSARSLRTLRRQGLDAVLPSHGTPLRGAAAVDAALAQTAEALEAFVAARDPGRAELAAALDRPLETVCPHLLRDRFGVSSNWVLLTADGHALWIDYGYAHAAYITQAGGDRAGKRPVLHGLEQLRHEFGVTAVDAVVVTHHHDDHVAGIEALRRATGAQVWAPANVADVLEHPHAYKTQCLWYDPIPVDRILPLGEAVDWRGIALTAHAQPGHTRYAACIAFTVDGSRCLAIGDQFPHNYIYANQFAMGDYPRTVSLWRRLAPDRILPGHGPAQDGPEAIERFAAHAEATDALHAQLLPLEEIDFGPGGQAVEVYPYQAVADAGATLLVRVTARNPLAAQATLRLRLVVPAGWRAEPAEATASAPARGSATVAFSLTVGPQPVRRARYAVDLTAGERAFGQVEEGFVTVRGPGWRPEGGG
jgi:glyoxylase-like metal-dependent hydrolase (beta-lactamase superfamily II)